MEAKRLEQLISGYLSRSLTEAETAELAAALQDSAEARSTAARHLLLDRLIHGAARKPVDADRVMRALGARGVADQVLAHLERETEWSATRRLRRHRGVPATRRAWWTSLLVAASALALLTLSVVRDGTSPRATRKRAEGPVETPAPATSKAVDPVLPQHSKPDPVRDREPERPEEPRPGTQDRPAERAPEPRTAAKTDTPPGKIVAPTEPRKPEGTRADARLLATTVEQVEDEVYITAGATRTLAKGGEVLAAGHGVLTAGPKSRAAVRFPDGTRVHLLGDTEIRDILEVLGARGKRLSVAAGTIDADVQEQPKEKPLVIGTPHGEAKVVGTTLRLIVDTTGKGSTRLEVKEGKVQLRRRSDGKTIEVIGGHHAVAAVGLELAVRRTPRAPAKRPDGLPYDASCPIVCVNDGAPDHLDDYLMVLASAGDIDLRGIVTSISVAPFNPYVTWEARQQIYKSRLAGVQYARKSGLSRIPDPIAGPVRHLERPPSGKIEDTRPITSPATQLILTEARLTTPEHPLVVVAGVGPLTPVADAVLLDPSIADRVVVTLATGQTLMNLGDYGTWSDPWAAYIVVQRFRTYVVPMLVSLQVTAAKLSELPDTEYRRWMATKNEADGDIQAALSLLRSDYVVRTQRMAFDRWAPDGIPPHDIPKLKDDPAGNVWFVTQVNGPAGEEEWWRAIKNPAAWGSRKSK